MPTHSILSTGPLLADPEPIDDNQTNPGPKVGRDDLIRPEEDVVRIGEEGPGTQTGGTVKTGRTEPIQPETKD